MTTSVSDDRTRWPHRSVGLVVVGVVLLLVIALAGGVLIGRSTKHAAAPVKGLASQEVISAIDASFAALNRGDWDAFGTYWAKDGILEEPTSHMYAKGRQDIVSLNQGIGNLGTRMYRTGPVIQIGDMAAYAVTGGYGMASASDAAVGLKWIDVVELNDKLEISHMWTGFTAEQAP